MSESREHPASQTNFEAAVQLGYVLVRSYRGPIRGWVGLDFGTTMASRKAADHTLYHLSPKGFWKKFREFFYWNPCYALSQHLAVNR